jgi:hypothetical protein
MLTPSAFPRSAAPVAPSKLPVIFDDFRMTEAIPYISLFEMPNNERHFELVRVIVSCF